MDCVVEIFNIMAAGPRLLVALTDSPMDSRIKTREGCVVAYAFVPCPRLSLLFGFFDSPSFLFFLLPTHILVVVPVGYRYFLLLC